MKFKNKDLWRKKWWCYSITFRNCYILFFSLHVSQYFCQILFSLSLLHFLFFSPVIFLILARMWWRNCRAFEDENRLQKWIIKKVHEGEKKNRWQKLECNNFNPAKIVGNFFLIFNSVHYILIRAWHRSKMPATAIVERIYKN